MFYKKVNDMWLAGSIIVLPTRTVLNESNRENDYGWVWHDEPPKEYLDWIEEIKQKNDGFSND